MASPIPDGPGAFMDDSMQVERNAGLIMATNNSSIVSKRSVERLYLPQPHFYRYFVKKPIRRSPTINRGYWLRMKAIDWVVRQFLEKPSEQKKVILNLGCGYDPLPFQWLAHEGELCANTKFIDVDYEPLMDTKKHVILDSPKMKDLLRSYNDDWTSDDPSILLDCDEYAAIGCDLRNLKRLGRLLRAVADIDQCLVLCVAEVSITYMHTDAADALIAYTSSLSRDVTFCLLEQCCPDRWDHPFFVTMMKHFEKIGTPLHSVLKYTGNHTQAQRFREAGFSHMDFQNLWELWANPNFLSPSGRLSLDQVEPFDEWEEFILFASHYCLIVAHNRDAPAFPVRRKSRRDSDASLGSDISARTASPHRPETQYFAYRYCKDVGDLCQRHHGSAYPTPEQDAIAVHGGVGPKARLGTTAVCRAKDNPGPAAPVLSPSVGARCCHTITMMHDGTNLLVGGRLSPTQPLKDCWIQRGDAWVQVHDLPEARYRHRVLPVFLPNNVSGAILFGGKTGPAHVAVDTLLWDPNKGWTVLRSLRSDPIPRFGASFIRLGFNHGLLFGGMRQDGVICQGFWRWSLVLRDNNVLGVLFRTSHALDATVGAYPWFARFGASYNLIRDEILIIGGVAKSGCIPLPYELLSLLGSFSNFGSEETEMTLKLSCVTPSREPGCPRPLLVGHSTHRTKSGISIILGGGATCFSFGNYFNRGIWVLYEKVTGYTGEWAVCPSKAATLLLRDEKGGTIEQPSLSEMNTTDMVPEKPIITAAEFAATVRSHKPSIFKNLDFGPCVRSWTLNYLRDKTSTDRTVIVHESETRNMNFQRKDFKYTTMPFHQFLTTLESEASHLYLRSLAAKEPTQSPANICDDWADIASDFLVPSQLQAIASRIHSSPLRISNDITMWLHYDVMANVLFQIRGVKKLVLFPPSDLETLDFPAGSTTSTLDIFSNTTSGLQWTINAPEGTSPQVAMLKPGDVLFIPPLWAHTGVSLPDSVLLESHNETGSTSSHPLLRSPAPTTSGKLPSANGELVYAYDRTSKHNPYLNIAVNIFFRNLPAGKYAAGRDVYGNRDLAAYEEGRRDLDKIVKRFAAKAKNGVGEEGLVNGVTEEGSIVSETISRDVQKAYLKRLAKELAAKADEL